MNIFIKKAESYAYDARRVWRMHPESVEWLRAQKSQGMDVPEEQDLVDLLKSGKTFLMKCTHTDPLSKAPRDAVYAMGVEFLISSNQDS